MAPRRLAALLLLALCLAAADARDGKAELSKVVAALQKAPQRRFSYFISLLNKSGLTASLDGYLNSRNITILAPDNNAFQNLAPKYRTKLVNVTTLKRVLNFHLLPGYISYHVLAHDKPGKLYTTLDAGHRLLKFPPPSKNSALVRLGPGTSTNPAAIYHSNQYVDYIVSVQAIDQVLIPPEVK
eukprot:SM000116S24219  [mRNA]  locus=s116:172012:172844:- [translate_table: standard]